MLVAAQTGNRKRPVVAASAPNRVPRREDALSGLFYALIPVHLTDMSQVGMVERFVNLMEDYRLTGELPGVEAAYGIFSPQQLPPPSKRRRVESLTSDEDEDSQKKFIMHDISTWLTAATGCIGCYYLMGRPISSVPALWKAIQQAARQRYDRPSINNQDGTPAGQVSDADMQRILSSTSWDR